MRNKHRSRNTTPKDKPAFKTEEKFREKAGDFPELVSSDFPELAPVVNKTEEKPTSKWANIVAMETEEEEKKQDTQKEFQEELKKLGPKDSR